MKRLIPALAIVLGWASAALAAEPGTLTSLRAIQALSKTEASQSIPVAFEATVSYYNQSDINLFLEDGGQGIYVKTRMNATLAPGDRVLVRGKTHAGFRADVVSESITVLGHGAPPKPVAASFDQLIRADLDCMRVKVRAEVLSADMVADDVRHSIDMRLRMDGGYIDATVITSDPPRLRDLLDAEVDITGVAAGRTDSKSQLTGITLDVNTFADVKILKHSSSDLESLPVTPMDKVLGGYHVVDFRHRIRVHGTITYFEPGSAAVLQEGNKSIWVQTQLGKPLRVGNIADATGFPDKSGGLLALTYADIQESDTRAPISPQPVTLSALASGSHAFDLVSIEGRVLAEVRQGAQDEYVLDSDGQVFAAIYHHPAANSGLWLPPMKQVPVGSTIRVTGINLVSYGSNPFQGPVSFSLLLRSFDDVSVVELPSWLTVHNLTRVVELMVLLVIAFGIRQWILEHKVHRQTIALSARIEAEAALERRMAQLEQQRSRILEDINGTRPLAEIIESITELVSFTLDGAPCWCEIVEGARLGTSAAEASDRRSIQMDILSKSGQVLAVLFAAPEGKKQAASEEGEEREEIKALEMGARLAKLAIETRRVYSDLVYRSEFDLLTDIHNRFSLDQQLDICIEGARQKAGIFGLIYIDLDDFKQINDSYGHHVGDLYLQDAALRMKRQLRAGDMLARLGGDEFAALLPAVRSRADAEEVALRLERCFDSAFTAEGHVLRGSASVGVALFPEDGATKDRILSSADAAMYAAKETKRKAGPRLVVLHTGE
ncbi:MAG: GGDEF domain-containing protein [Terracidiphilus sp.]